MDKPYPGMDKRKSKGENLMMGEKELEKEWYEEEEKREEENKDNFRYVGRAEGFLIVPDEFTYCGDHLSPGAKMMWHYIFKHNWAKDEKDRTSWPGRERLAIMCGKSVNQADQYIKELKQKKVLVTKRRGVGLTNLYILLDPPKEWMDETLRKLQGARERKKREGQRRLEKQKKILVDFANGASL